MNGTSEPPIVPVEHDIIQYAIVYESSRAWFGRILTGIGEHGAAELVLADPWVYMEQWQVNGGRVQRMRAIVPVEHMVSPRLVNILAPSAVVYMANLDDVDRVTFAKILADARKMKVELRAQRAGLTIESRIKQ